MRPWRQALRIPDLDGTDLSAVTEAGTVFRRLAWVPIDAPDPAEGGDRPGAARGDADQFLAGITPGGQTFPLAHNRLSDEGFAGATFSPDGGTLFVNVQVPGTTFAIWGPWH